MNRLFAFTLVIALISVSCSEATPEANTAQNEVKAAEPVKGNRLLTLEIEGMTCVMGCGGSIRKELAATQAIESCEFEFEEGRAMNTAKISFDKDKITVDKIIEIVSTMNKGQFKVGNNETEDISVNIRTKVEEVPSDKVDDSKLKVSTSTNIEMPNFVEILASFFHN
ncbi:MAG: hypothetical protein N4A41_03715 [Crocinitomicaceae bacterium]|jgi:Cu+-exporting ATPase|nr:hypothetical protein [Crocinitomicaceae bacterium]